MYGCGQSKWINFSDGVLRGIDTDREYPIGGGFTALTLGKIWDLGGTPGQTAMEEPSQMQTHSGTIVSTYSHILLSVE